jgi:plasmid stabilization system protein ParE
MDRYTVRLRRKALTDVRPIRAWYEKIDSSLEERFLQALNEALDRIETRPNAYQVVYRSTRRVLHKFPYSVFYIVQARSVVVLAVIHHKRDWKLAQGRSE